MQYHIYDLEQSYFPASTYYIYDVSTYLISVPTRGCFTRQVNCVQERRGVW